jgi:hypothetical protein
MLHFRITENLNYVGNYKNYSRFRCRFIQNKNLHQYCVTVTAAMHMSAEASINVMILTLIIHIL